MAGAAWLAAAGLVALREWSRLQAAGGASVMLRVLTITADAALLLAFLGLFIGYSRKAEHLPR